MTQSDAMLADILKLSINCGNPTYKCVFIDIIDEKSFMEV